MWYLVKQYLHRAFPLRLGSIPFLRLNLSTVGNIPNGKEPVPTFIIPLLSCSQLVYFLYHPCAILCRPARQNSFGWLINTRLLIMFITTRRDRVQDVQGCPTMIDRDTGRHWSCATIITSKEWQMNLTLNDCKYLKRGQIKSFAALGTIVIVKLSLPA